jgi:hypothetical protein
MADTQQTEEDDFEIIEGEEPVQEPVQEDADDDEDENDDDDEAEDKGGEAEGDEGMTEVAASLVALAKKLSE